MAEVTVKFSMTTFTKRIEVDAVNKEEAQGWVDENVTTDDYEDSVSVLVIDDPDNEYDEEDDEEDEDDE